MEIVPPTLILTLTLNQTLTLTGDTFSRGQLSGHHDKCFVKKSINMLTSCGCYLHENTCVWVSFQFWVLWNFLEHFFEEHLQTAASENMFTKIIRKDN